MDEKEEWRPVVGFEGAYEVSSLGRVRSIDRSLLFPNKKTGMMPRKLKGRIIKQQLDGRKLYLQVPLSNGKSKRYLVHRLVAEAFIENPLNLLEVNHKDENKANNAASNLEWCDHKYNNNYGTKLWATRGEKNPMATLTADIVRQIRKEYIPSDKEYGVKGLATRYGISMTHICQIIYRKRWGWLD